MSTFAVVFSRALLAGAAIPAGEAGVGAPPVDADRGTARIRDGLLTVMLTRAAR